MERLHWLLERAFDEEVGQLSQVFTSVCIYLHISQCSLARSALMFLYSKQLLRAYDRRKCMFAIHLSLHAQSQAMQSLLQAVLTNITCPTCLYTAAHTKGIIADWSYKGSVCCSTAACPKVTLYAQGSQ